MKYISEPLEKNYGISSASGMNFDVEINGYSIEKITWKVTKLQMRLIRYCLVRVAMIAWMREKEQKFIAWRELSSAAIQCEPSLFPWALSSVRGSIGSKAIPTIATPLSKKNWLWFSIKLKTLDTSEWQNWKKSRCAALDFRSHGSKEQPRFDHLKSVNRPEEVPSMRHTVCLGLRIDNQEQ